MSDENAEHILASLQQLNANSEQLLQQVPSVTTYAMASEMKTVIGTLCTCYIQLVEGCEENIRTLHNPFVSTSTEAGGPNAAASGSLLLEGLRSRVFGSARDTSVKSRSIEWLQEIVRIANSQVTLLANLAEHLPGSADEKKQLVGALKYRKKELALEKKQINWEMKQVRIEARQAIASTPGMFFGKGTPVDVAYNRVSVNRRKEEVLAPLEDQKRHLEQAIADIDRELLYLERYK